MIGRLASRKKSYIVINEQIIQDSQKFVNTKFHRSDVQNLCGRIGETSPGKAQTDTVLELHKLYVVVSTAVLI